MATDHRGSYRLRGGLHLPLRNEPEAAQRRQEEAKARADEKLPRKVNEANGCEVWAFKPADRWLYFTRCGASTETVNTWDECRTVQSGKTSRQECTPKSMAIAQQPKGQTP
ncbi:hypothetical protein [Delftia sp.]|uniref:hypothetical protein n=1 Tax=Delftia sp. TaxID=1886637 RepID=UPI00259CAD0A|nr:hypothetical protein [Delftia sp.]